MILISFVIPAYNAGLYIEACIDSIYRVKMGSYEREVIVVNDGSTDDTAEVLKRLTQIHPDLIVMNQPNQGQSVARNVGMRHARGKYIYFADADDEIDVPNASLFPFDCLEKEDIDLYGVNLNAVEKRGKVPYRRYQPQYNLVYRPAREFLRDRNLQPCPCAYLYRRAFLEAEGLTFHEGIHHEDEEWAPVVFLKAASFKPLDVDFYLRYYRDESTTRTQDLQKQQRNLLDMLTVIETLDNVSKQNPELQPYLAYKLDYLCVDLLILMSRYKSNPELKKQIAHSLKTMGYLPLRKHKEWKYRLFRLYTRCIY